MTTFKSDFLIIGSGIAGLSAALRLSEFGKVNLIAKREINVSSTQEAQGGIASVSLSGDDFQKHISDTIIAGAGLCKKDVVETVVKQAPERIRELMKWGVRFDPDIGLEGGHSERRIFHAGDATGSEIETALVKNVKSNPNISVFEHYTAVNLIKIDGKCWGAYVLDNKEGKVNTFLAGATVLATGGACKVYVYTSNPDIATGDGVAMAYRIGCKIANMEFMQFHPTCLFHREAKTFLISEALRGEGAVLKDKNGVRFMTKYHPSAELAPRDIVARAIDAEMKKTGDQCVFLDISFKSTNFIKKRFPMIYKTCLSFGIDITKSRIPVVPAAHYMCGGVLTDIRGRTTVPGLYAIGEVSCTGLHGANRLASNSLLEGLVFSYQMAEDIKMARKGLTSKKFPKVLPWKKGRATPPDEAIVITHNWYEIRRLMWNYVGIVRSNKRLARALVRIENLKKEINQYYWDFIITQDLVELRNLATVAEVIIKSAIMRKESRGFHYNIDYPKKLKTAKDTVL
ncbi:MAG: L-aspartate oxidase [Elusimicrobia bacterium ADurb.Bin231]|nr:MAG: L-aspartate oxidase [Elusimicrobia bacterium ADurb.Bin231]